MDNWPPPVRTNTRAGRIMDVGVRNRTNLALWAVTISSVLAALTASLRAGEIYEEEPIRYSAAPAADPVARLQSRLERGETKLNYDDTTGYLPSLLKELD